MHHQKLAIRKAYEFFTCTDALARHYEQGQTWRFPVQHVNCSYHLGQEEAPGGIPNCSPLVLMYTLRHMPNNVLKVFTDTLFLTQALLPTFLLYSMAHQFCIPAVASGYQKVNHKECGRRQWMEVSRTGTLKSGRGNC
jgi:hypothetical protein